LRVGDVLVSGLASSPVRILEDFTGKPIKEAGPSKPVRVVGWSEQPEVGGLCFTFKNKKEAEVFLETERERIGDETRKIAAQQRMTAHEILANMETTDSHGEIADPANKVATLPIIIKGDTNGTLEAVKYELQKIKVERVTLKVVHSGIGDITENDVKLAGGKTGTLIVGFNTKVDNSARQLALRMGIQIETFDIIYKLTEWLQIKAEENIPKRHIEEETGTLKILKVFSTNKDKQVIGGRVEIGTIHVHDRVKIMRREVEIGRGHIRELQQTKNKVGSVEEGKECGLMVESKLEVVAGDKLVAFEVVLK
jgi:translation initiation factor IF-2